MSIIDSGADRQLFNARIDAMKSYIHSLRLEIDRCFQEQPTMPVAQQRTLAEIDVDLATAAIALGVAQLKVVLL